MGLAFVNYWRGSGAAPALPAGLQPRDLMILVALSDDASSLLAAPAGWSSIFSHAINNRYWTQIALKYAQAGEVAPAMGTVANLYDAIIVAYRGNIGPRFVSACTDWTTPTPPVSPYAVTLPNVGDGDQIGIVCGGTGEHSFGPPVTSDDAVVDVALGAGAGDLDFTFAFLHAAAAQAPIDAALRISSTGEATWLLMLSLLTQTDTGLTMLL